MLLSTVIQTLKRPLLVCNELWRAPLSEPEIERMLVCSGIFSSIGYDTKRRALQVEFTNGCLYRIDDVSAKTYRALMQAESFDRYYQENIQKRFEMTKIGAVTPLGG